MLTKKKNVVKKRDDGGDKIRGMKRDGKLRVEKVFGKE